MVTRKPLPESAALDPAVPRDALSPRHGEDEAIWRDGTQQQQQPRQMTNFTPADLPRSLQPGPTDSVSELGEEDNIWAERVPAFNTGDMNQVPAALRPGGSHGVEADLGPGGSSKPETNPFKRKMSLSASGAGQSKPGAPSNIPPVPSVPVVDFSQLGVNESRPNPWQSPVDEASGITPPAPRLLEQDYDGNNAWASARPSRQPTPGLGSESPALVSLPSEEGQSIWGDEPKREGQGAWGEELKGQTLSAPPAATEPNPEPLSRQSTWENFKDEDPVGQTTHATVPTTAPATTPPIATKADPEVPPAAVPQGGPPGRISCRGSSHRRTQIRTAELPPVQPSRPVDKSEDVPERQRAVPAKLPWVNALTLTTPAEKTNTALVETLRSREQVSLGLLLDAVFDELMSERRAQLDVALPDVTELYDFLKGLHTGMNVNPRFVPTPEVVTAFKRTSLTHLHPTERTDMIPGTFEHTREMVLYSTFSIPLIHGWLPAKDDAVCEALSRQAASYEDTQNLLFPEEELDQKLCDPNQGLTPEEQQLYQDILTIKSFLSTSATQLTKAGLNIIKTAMKPGSMAILFRNDHFSTLYRHPQSLELFTLVTDAGYAGHAEVVWESLVDINGESAEFFSGDFRLVGGATGRPGFSEDGGLENWADAVSDNNNDWTTVQPRRGRTQTAQQSASAEPPLSPNHEQEDRDLPLALQLQGEEDEGARNEPRTPPSPTTQTVRSLIPPRNAPAPTASTGPARMTNRPAEDGLDDAPPSYEQAAKQLPYVPPQGHPSHPSSTGTGSGSRPGQGQGQGQGGGPRPLQQRQQQQQQQQGSPRPGAPLGGRSPAMGMGAGGIIVPQHGRGNGYPGG
ncbi:hypothetical protein CHGG_08045 [Chaetomium globosum CBS 148.51]|uniref:MINDY deubiquitinase domain-containing protein n=1 Tax=Chaetomium globosum (strain ATCC 6205 / CBS 148.51 / DSM 1962 / NBRC 6347 / NRRL 1970) TaxID=306901 RepID=Q2GVF9_CHAGB|nr:uncharacterized protein CHGG_08045 [Chaetomium globosum CBS 148.51]EAQ86792.1 hypothetical protein CHGG_08045 [Chaetomium globosum CBS 148.51]